MKTAELTAVYRSLRRAFGHQRWWPGDTPFEVMIGAILTQNTAWSNVEKAIRNLKDAGLLHFRGMKALSRTRLARLIRPAGYYNIKAKRLKAFIAFLDKRYGGSVKRMFAEKGDRLREALLSVSGIGPETADSILLYAGQKPYFVIDAYTVRIFTRHRLETGRKRPLDYHEWQRLFMSHLPRSEAVYNDFHAQIVALGKDYCKSAKPLCGTCPLASYL